MVKLHPQPLQFFLKDDGWFPNSDLPVLIYKQALDLPLLFKEYKIRSMLRRHGWTNNWRNGIYTYHHYHSNTHEVMAVIAGKTRVRLGGDRGITVTIWKGDVILIPAGVAHKNLGKEDDVTCIGGYPQGKDFDMNYGTKDERAPALARMARLKVPALDPVTGKKDPLNSSWKEYMKKIKRK